MDELEQIRIDFDKQREELIKEYQKRKNELLNDYQIQSQQLNSDMAIKKDSQEYLDLKNKLKKTYDEDVAQCDKELDEDLNELDSREEMLIRHIRNKQTDEEELIWSNVRKVAHEDDELHSEEARLEVEKAAEERENIMRDKFAELVRLQDEIDKKKDDALFIKKQKMKKAREKYNDELKNLERSYATDFASDSKSEQLFENDKEQLTKEYYKETQGIEREYRYQVSEHDNQYNEAQDKIHDYYDDKIELSESFHQKNIEMYEKKYELIRQLDDEFERDLQMGQVPTMNDAENELRAVENLDDSSYNGMDDEYFKSLVDYQQNEPEIINYNDSSYDSQQYQNQSYQDNAMNYEMPQYETSPYETSQYEAFQYGNSQQDIPPMAPIDYEIENYNYKTSDEYKQLLENINQTYDTCIQNQTDFYQNIVSQDYGMSSSPQDDLTSKWLNYRQEEQQKAVEKFESSYDTVINSDFNQLNSLSQLDSSQYMNQTTHYENNQNGGYSQGGGPHGIDGAVLSSYTPNGIVTSTIGPENSIQNIDYHANEYHDEHKSSFQESHHNQSSLKQEQPESYFTSGLSDGGGGGRGPLHEENSGPHSVSPDRKEARLNWGKYFDEETWYSPIDSVRRHMVQQSQQEESGTVLNGIRGYRYAKDGFAIAVTISDLGRTIQQKKEFVGNIGRYLKGDDLKHAKNLRTTLQMQKEGVLGWVTNKNGNIVYDEKTGKPIARVFNSNKKAFKDAKKQVKEARKKFNKKKRENLKKGLKEKDLSFIKKGFKKGKVDPELAEFLKRYNIEHKKEQAKDGKFAFLSKQLRKSDDIGVNGIANGVDFFTNRYVRRAVANSYSLAAHASRIAGKTAVKAAKKYLEATGRESIVLYVEGKRAGMKAASEKIKGRVVSNFNGGFYNKGKAFLKKTVPNPVINGKNNAKAFVKKGWKKLNESPLGRGAKYAKKVVMKPFQVGSKGIQMISRALSSLKAFLIKVALWAIGIFLGLVILISFIMWVVSAASSLIINPDSPDDKIVLTPFVERLDDADDDFRKKIEKAVKKYDDVQYVNGLFTDNYKEILSMTAVRFQNDLGSEDTVDNDRGDFVIKRNRRQDVYDYIDDLYEASHSYSIETQKYKDNCQKQKYKCTEKGHEKYNPKGCKIDKQDYFSIKPNPEKGDTYKGSKGKYTFNGEYWECHYCPGEHKECPGHERALVTVNTLRFNALFLVDTSGNEIINNAIAGDKLGEFEITGYCTCEECCGKYSPEVTGKPAHTATGTTPKEGRTIAVDPKVIPYGTQVVINGQVYVAEDTGEAIKGKRIDIYFEEHETALSWGRRKMAVYKAKEGSKVPEGSNQNDEIKEWLGWTEDNRQWAMNIYNMEGWDEVYEGWAEHENAGVEVPPLDFEITGDSEKGVAIAKKAQEVMGSPYYWGASGPKMFDCSGLVCWTHNQGGVKLPRSTANVYGRSGQKVNKSDLQPGDVVAIARKSSSRYHHIGVYVGHNTVIEALGEGETCLGNHVSRGHVVKATNLDIFIKNKNVSYRRLY